MNGRIEVLTVSVSENKMTEISDKIHKTCMEKKLNLLESIREMQRPNNLLNGSEKLKLQAMVEAFYQHIATTFLKKISGFVDSQRQKKQSMNHALEEKRMDLQKESMEMLAETKEKYVKALQKSASDYRDFIIAKNFKSWPKTFKQFSHQFGEVCAINQSLSPYELDFGRTMSKSKGARSSEAKHFDFSCFTLKALISMTNRMIQVCYFYEDMKALDIIETNLEKNNFSFLKMMKSGIIVSHLKKIILLEDDEECILRNVKQNELNLKLLKNKFEEEIKHENNSAFEKSKNIENIAVVHLANLKNVVEEFFHFSFLYQSAFQKYSVANEKIKKINAMFAKNFHEIKPVDDEKKSSLQQQSKLLLDESTLEFEEWSVLFNEMLNLKNRMTHYLTLFIGEFPESLLGDFRAIFMKEFQRLDELQAEKKLIDREFQLIKTMHSILPLCFTFFSHGITLLTEASFLHEVEEYIYQQLDILENTNHSSLIEREKVVQDIQKNLQLIQAKAKIVIDLKLVIDTHYAEIKQQLSKKSLEMYEPLQEFMALVNHENAFTLSFFESKDGISRRLEACLLKMIEEKTLIKNREDEKIAILQLKAFIKESLMKNPHLWRPTCCSGSNILLQNKTFSVADGIAEIFDANKKIEDPYQWLFRVKKIIRDRCEMMKLWKYSVFNIRGVERNTFYQTLKMHLDSKELNVESLKEECKKISKFRG